MQIEVGKFYRFKENGLRVLAVTDKWNTVREFRFYCEEDDALWWAEPCEVEPWTDPPRLAKWYRVRAWRCEEQERWQCATAWHRSEKDALSVGNETFGLETCELPE